MPPRHFNGLARYGATPGRKFTFTFPVRGSRDGLKFRVVDGSLPDGATLGEANGILSGRVEKPGEYAFTVAAENAVGRAVGASYAWRDVIECRDLGDGDTLKVTLPPHATRVLRGVKGDAAKSR